MAPDVATVTADSSNSEILASLNDTQRKEWRTTGKLPDLPEAPPKKTEAKTEADSSPAAKETPEPAKAAETSAEPVPAKEEHKPKGAEARIKELLAETKRLNAELETARKAPIIAPAKVEEVAKPRRTDVDAKTGQPMYATDEVFEEAMEKYLVAKVTADVNKANAKAQSEARIAEQNRIIEQKWQNSLKIANENHPDFAKVLDIGDETVNGKALKNVFRNKDLKTIKSNGVLDAWILDSEIGAEILYHLAKNPAEIERIQSLSAFAAARELTKLEDKLSASTSAPTKKEEKAESSSPNVTRAPAPAADVSGKATAPANEVEAALKRENFKSYKAAADAEEYAKRKKS